MIPVALYVYTPCVRSFTAIVLIPSRRFPSGPCNPGLPSDAISIDLSTVDVRWPIIRSSLGETCESNERIDARGSEWCSRFSSSLTALCAPNVNFCARLASLVQAQSAAVGMPRRRLSRAECAGERRMYQH